MHGHRTTTEAARHDGTDGQRTDDDDGLADEMVGRTLDANGDGTDTTGRTDTRVIIAISSCIFVEGNFATTLNRMTNFVLDVFPIFADGF